MISKLDIVAIPSQDAERSRSFYIETLGLRPDDNARDRAITVARRTNPAADHAAQATVIYSLQRPAMTDRIGVR